MSVASDAAIAAMRHGLFCEGISPQFSFAFGSLPFSDVWDTQIHPLFHDAIVQRRRSKYDNGPCFVYAFRFIHNATGLVSYKIGITGNFESRFSQMRGGTPPGFSADIYRHGRCKTRRQAEEIERSIIVSAACAMRWSHGEWVLESATP